MATKTKKKTKQKSKSTKKRTNKKSKNKNIIALIIGIVLLIIVIVIAAFGVHNMRSEHYFNSKEEYVDGVDVSEHNGKIKWGKMAKEVDFAIIRVGYRGYANGELYKDKKAEYNLKHANEEGVKVGAYVYTQAITEEEAEKEAKLALEVIKGYDVDLPIFIDYEYGADAKGKLTGRLYDADLRGKDATAIINAFCKVIKKAGYTPGVYSSSSVYADIFDVQKIDRKAVIWVADYNDHVTYNGEYDIWQYTNKGKIKGNGSKYIDKNHWYIKK